MGKQPHKSFPEDAGKKKLKAQSEQIRWLEKEIKRLKADLKTLNDAFKKSADYMADESGPIPVEKLIKDAQKHKPLIQTKKETVPISEKEATRSKFDEWNRNRKRKEDEEA